MNLYLLRHGIAAEPGSLEYRHDSERPLTDEGERKLQHVAQALEKLEITFDVILSSPFVRAWQTASIVAESLEISKKLRRCEPLIPGGSLKQLIQELNALKPAPKDVLLVGHEPSLSHHISFLISGHADAAVTMKKGALCKLSADSLRYGRCATLEWLLTAKLMAAMG
jgi:phosphohistidine phosphatase